MSEGIVIALIAGAVTILGGIITGGIRLIVIFLQKQGKKTSSLGKKRIEIDEVNREVDHKEKNFIYRAVLSYLYGDDEAKTELRSEERNLAKAKENAQTRISKLNKDMTEIYDDTYIEMEE